MVPLNMVESVEEAATHMGTAIVRVRIQEELRESESRYRRLSEHLEEQVRKQVAELRQAQTLAAIGQMVSVVAHEIRNPLLNIQMGMDALRSALNNNSETPEILKEIEHGVNLLNDTVSELLDYSRAVRLERVLQPIGEIVQQVLKALPQKLQNITVDFDWENEKREIFVDGPKMARVFMNIFTNAAEAMPEGGNLKIASTLDDSRQLSISVSDTGHGMDADDLEKLFQPFYTTKVNGTGLGLAISKKIIEAHDGSIAVSSRPANGTTVKIVLPIGLKK
jgi:signal transduction histidine kinase